MSINKVKVLNTVNLLKQCKIFIKYLLLILLLFICNLHCDKFNARREEKPNKVITVEIGGAVERPGKYNVSLGTTANEFINIAGLKSNNMHHYFIVHADNTREDIEIGRTEKLPQNEDLSLFDGIELRIIDEGKSNILQNGDFIYIPVCMGL
jgi:hypothetical protein